MIMCDGCAHFHCVLRAYCTFLAREPPLGIIAQPWQWQRCSSHNYEPIFQSTACTRCNVTSWDLSTVHLFPKGCIYICKFYCTENIQNVHNYRYNIPQSCPGITKHRCSALEKLCSLFNIIIFNTFSTNIFKCMSVWLSFVFCFFFQSHQYFTTFTIYSS